MNIALVGNPNVGKTTLFNALFKKNEHTGNWTGKTVEKARASFVYGTKKITVTDLPGTYSFKSYSKEEKETQEYLKNSADGVIVVADAAFLERGLCLLYEVLALSLPCFLIINYKDEALKKGISFDMDILKELLGIEVFFISAKNKNDIKRIKDAIPFIKKSEKNFPSGFDSINFWAKLLLRDIKYKKSAVNSKADKFFTGKRGIVFLFLIVAGVFWLTLFGANAPSSALSHLFGEAEKGIFAMLEFFGASGAVSSLILNVYGVLTAVVAVMLPPMAIFFPLFSFLEETGYLPRAAFCADRFFYKAGADGKQAMTTCMGLGCNAAGVIGARIIADKNRRLLAIITNSFIPCNGKLPMLMTLLCVFAQFCGAGDTAFAALLFLPVVIICFAMSLIATKLLTFSCIKQRSSLFAFELPPMRMADPVRILKKTLFDKTLKVLLRACVSAVPAGVVLWALMCFSFDGKTLLEHFCLFLQPFGVMIGLDGVLLAAFILGFPANEIVLPIALMIYSSAGSFVYSGDEALIFAQNGWSWVTALCAVIFAAFHFPCATTMLTIAKETKSAKAVLLSFALPLLCGIVICFAVSCFCRVFV